MVSRSQYISAVSEGKIAHDMLQAKSKDVTALESQLSRTQVMLQSARSELSQLQQALSSSVPKSELAAVRSDHCRMRAESDGFRARLDGMVSLSDLEIERWRPTHCAPPRADANAGP